MLTVGKSDLLRKTFLRFVLLSFLLSFAPTVWACSICNLPRHQLTDANLPVPPSPGLVASASFDIVLNAGAGLLGNTAALAAFERAASQ